MIPLRAGPLSAGWEADTGFLRRLRWGDREVLRGVYAAVRDRNWETVPGRFRELRREVRPEAFDVEFEAEHRQAEIHFVWRGRLSGTPDGTVVYTLDGMARTTFLKNRIGFCVLHPIRECTGARARQTRTDGSVIECRFPDGIEPQIFGQASFRDLQAVAHEVVPGVWAEVRFAGDVFEMEDQRNWTDASFKSYCTPLARPFPAEIAAGTRVRQTITFHWMGEGVSPTGSRVEWTATPDRPVRLRWSGQGRSPLPELGLQLGLPSAGADAPGVSDARGMRLLRRLPLSHLRVDWSAAAPASAHRLRWAGRQAAALGLPIELAWHVPLERGNAAEPLRLPGGIRWARVLALGEGEPATTQATFERVRGALGGGDVPVGAGSDGNFCELNREVALGRLPVARADFLFWAINPQVHVTDDGSVMENLEAQGDTVRTARAFAGGRPVRVTPITLRPRFNAVATDRQPGAGDDPGTVAGDPRQATLFGAAWTLGSLAALIQAGADGMTFYETIGPRGLMPQVPAQEGDDGTGSVAVYPLYHVFAWLAGPWQSRAVIGNDPTVLAALGLVGAGRQSRLLLANLTPETRAAEFRGLGTPTRALVLDDSTCPAATAEPEAFADQAGVGDGVGEVVNLKPWAVACIDFDLA